MCFVYEWELIFADGSRLPQHRIHPCGAGSPTSPCAEFELVREPARHASPPLTPRYVDGRPAAGSSTHRAGTLRNRRGADDIRLEFELHIPGTARSSESGSRSRPSSRRSSYQARGPGFGSVSTAVPIYTPAQYVTYNPHQLDNNWQQWTPPPRVITVDPARATPPATPRRSRSAGPTPGREHHHRHRSTSSSSRPLNRSSPYADTPRRSTVSLDDERAEQVRELSARIDRLVTERERARRMRLTERRIGEITAQIEELRHQRHRGGRRPVVELHQRGETVVRPPQRPHHRAGESLDERGRRALQRDVDAGARAAQLRGGNSEARTRPRRLTISEGGGGGGGGGLFEGLFRRPSGRRPREHVVFEGEPRHGERHR